MVTSNWGGSYVIILIGKNLVLMLKKDFLKIDFCINNFECNEINF